MIPPLARDYLDLGYDAIPLLPGAKPPFCKGWQFVAPVLQWQTAPVGANIGLRGRGDAQAAYADCDDWPTWETVARYLAGLGYYADGDFPLVATAHDNRHAYIRLAQRPAGDFRPLRRSFGKGELRYGPGAQVVAPGSVVDGREYRLLDGDLRQLPRLDLADLRDVVDLDAPTSPTSAKKPTLSRLARRLLDGENFTRYPSRSEADAALVAALVNTGHDFAGVLTLFATWPTSGKFAELRQERGEREAMRYLRRTFDRAAEWTDTHESEGRRVARQAQLWALSHPWPGVYGNSDMAVFLAHAEIAKQAGAVTYAASARRLAELAGVNKETAMKANRRLVDAGLVTYDRAHARTYANLYRLGVVQEPYTSSRGGREEVYGSCTEADAFRFRGLGKSAALVLSHLTRQPMTEAELAAATGKHRTTIARALQKMMRMVDPSTGEVLALVERGGEGWRAIAGVDLDAVARAVGTDGTGARQRAQHAKERAGFRRAIARAEAGTTPAGEGGA